MMVQMQAEAAKYPELNIEIANARNDTALQIEQIAAFVARGVDLLIVSPNESAPVTEIAAAAYDAGIPTIIWDRKIDSDRYTTCISADNYGIGCDVGRYISTVLPSGGNILEITGLMSSSPARERHEGFRSAISGRCSIYSVAGDWKPEVARRRVESIGDYSDIDVVFAHNDDMALAAYNAVYAVDTLSAARIKFIGIDALVGVNAVIDGRLQASFLYPTGGDKVLEIAHRILAGLPVEKHYALSYSLVDSSNAKTLKAQQEQIVSYQEQINRQKETLEQFGRNAENMQYMLGVVVAVAAVVAAMAVFALVLNIRLRRRNEVLARKNAEIERSTREMIEKHARIESVTADKLRFFTNITHEIRTPLTLILNPLDSIVKREKDPEIQRNIWTIQRNAMHLLRVVNQILDFRKIENNKMTLRLQSVDIVEFTREILSYFETSAETEKIIYKFDSDVDHLPLWIDADKIEQVFLNLLSNAFKYSQKYGTIGVCIIDNGPSVIIEVRDNGKGIDKESLPRIFDRFYSLDRKSNYSTGIGLHLTREYVELHHGRITADSEPGICTVFRVELFKGREHFGDNATFDDSSAVPLFTAETIDRKVETILSKRYNDTIVVAEDDPEILKYIVGELSQNFNVVAVSNGYDAVRAVKDNDVALVLSDVLMPTLNGFQLCGSIKSDVATCHIPVILLTALSDDNMRIYGIAEGADEYIHKPFNMQYLRVKIISIVEDRKQQASAFARNLRNLSVPKIESIPCGDDVFRDKLFNILEAQYGDSEFRIESMGDMLGMSRIMLYRKIMSLFGMPPSDLLRNYRLQKSLQLLSASGFNVSETAYAVGFSSPAYFAKCFKEAYRITPSEYMRRNAAVQPPAEDGGRQS